MVTLQNISSFTINIISKGRKWYQVKIQGQGYWYDGQVLINEFSQHYQQGKAYRVRGVLTTQVTKYGKKFDITPTEFDETDVQVFEAEKKKRDEINKALYWIRENYKKGFVYQKGIDVLIMNDVFETYRTEINEMKRAIALRKDAEKKERERARVEASRQYAKGKAEERAQKQSALQKELQGLICFNLPYKSKIGDVICQDGYVGRVEKIFYQDDATSFIGGDEKYFDTIFFQGFFYPTYCKDISQTTEGITLLNKRQKEKEQSQEATAIRKILKNIKRIVEEKGTTIKKDDIKGIQLDKHTLVTNDDSKLYIDLDTKCVMYSYYMYIDMDNIDPWHCYKMTISPELQTLISQFTTLISEYDNKYVQ
jgi:hypothetical protein